MENRGRDWRTMLLGISSIGVALSAFAFAALIIIYTAFGLLQKDTPQNDPSLLEDVVIASGIVFIGAVFLPSVYYFFQRLRGKAIPEETPKLLKIWQGFLLVLLWAGTALLAQLLVDNAIFKWFTPPLYLLAIGTPVYFLVRLVSGGLNAGSRQRFWGVLATSIALGVTLAIVVEMLLVIVGLVFVGVYIGLHPDLSAVFKQITDQITNASSIDAAMNTLEPWLNNPVAFLIALFFFSGIAPVVEEIAKSLAAWTIFDRLVSPAQGFVVGALSGAGFGLFESLMASAMPDSSWATDLMARGGSTMMHIMAASLTGWGVAAFRIGNPGIGRGLRLVAMYVLAMFMHGLWNASAIMIVFGNLRGPAAAGAQQSIGSVLNFSGESMLIILCLTIPVALGIINRRFRMTNPLVPVPRLENIPNLNSLDENEEKLKGVQ